MSGIMLFSLLIIFSIGLAYLYTRFIIIIHYPENKRKIISIGTFALFIFLALGLFGAITAKNAIDKAIEFHFDSFEQYVIANYSGTIFVTYGLNLNKGNDSIAEIKKAIAEIESKLPPNTEFGIPKIAYDMIIDLARDKVNTYLSTDNSAIKIAEGFADANGFLTVSSVFSGFKNIITKIVNTTFVIIISILSLIFFIFLLFSFAAVSNFMKYPPPRIEILKPRY